ncbi:MAG: hypothetical protein MK226_04220, partial [Saprospiraceae bacterium]|nr:hypothetical protein [Saprospiraceae bacterium]
MKNLSILLWLIIPSFAFSQNPFDECSEAIELTLEAPSDCPSFLPAITSLSIDNIGATDSDPNPIFSNCNFNNPCADVW